jgi:hypothetical protein
MLGNNQNCHCEDKEETCTNKQLCQIVDEWVGGVKFLSCYPLNNVMKLNIYCIWLPKFQHGFNELCICMHACTYQEKIVSGFPILNPFIFKGDTWTPETTAQTRTLSYD